MVKLLLAAAILLALAPENLGDFVKFDSIKIVKSSWQSIQTVEGSRYALRHLFSQSVQIKLALPQAVSYAYL